MSASLRRRRSWAARFFQFLSKTDPDVIAHVSRYAQLSQSALGFMVLLTAILAWMSGGYAVLVSLRNAAVAACAGFVYALVILVIDREIVASSGRLAALLRLPLALVIGVVVAVPLELRLFEGRINEELQRTSNERNVTAVQRYKDVEDAYVKRASALDDDIKRFRSNVELWGRNVEAEIVGRVEKGRTGLPGAGPAHAAALAQQALNQRLLEETVSAHKALDSEAQATLARYSETRDQEFVKTADDLVARYEAMQAVIGRSQAARGMTWAITLLIVLVEMCPALLKLMSPQNDYHLLLDSIRRDHAKQVRALIARRFEHIDENPGVEMPQLLDAISHRTSNTAQDGRAQVPVASGALG